jgi:hypothetical protein
MGFLYDLAAHPRRKNRNAPRVGHPELVWLAEDEDPELVRLAENEDPELDQLLAGKETDSS